MYFFTADEHYGHVRILEYTNRPFSNVKEMNNEIINRHNEVVTANDIVIHAGDFSLASREEIMNKYVSRLNGNHIFLKGSHDYWLNKKAPTIFEKTIDKQKIVVCHYAMRTWAASHYNSYMLFGHSHGKLEPIGKQWDIGVDNNNFYPLSFEEIKIIMSKRPDNFNLVKK